MIWDDTVAHLSRGVGAVAILAVTFWKGDDLLSNDGRKLIAARLEATMAEPSQDAKGVSDLLRAYFSGRLPAWRFALNVLVFTLASMLLLMIVYVAITPGFFKSLVTDRQQLSAVVSQFLLDGLIKTFAANYIGFSIFAKRLEQGDFDPLKSLFVDVIVKVVAFIAVTALIYQIYAQMGSFTGSSQKALEAVRPTILAAAKFQNLTAVYLYSLAISSLPIYLAALLHAMAVRPRFSAAIQSMFFWLPFHDKPVRALAVVLGCFFGIFAMLAGTLAIAAGRWI